MQSIWSRVQAGKVPWSTEAGTILPSFYHSCDWELFIISDIQRLVTDVILEAIKQAYLEQALHCVNELSVFQLQPDIWIVVLIYFR